MKKLEKNICKAHGIEGEKWLQSLPSIIKNCVQHWQLTGIQAVQNMTWNMEHLKLFKDDYFFINALHKNQIEIYNKKDILRVVCDLNGIISERLSKSLSRKCYLL